MTQTTPFSTSSAVPLPDVFSQELTQLFDRVKPGIVQVRTDQRGGGTGFVWQRDGRILTNNHVVPSDRQHIQVHFPDGRTFDAKVLRRNPQLDLALLKIDGEQFTSLPLGDSKRLRVGEWVFAIGHPWGQRWTVTAGILSVMSTLRISQNRTAQYIKSDVRLAPGNSGGPLLDADGNVVGINAMIFGGDLSASIPSHVVNNWLAEQPKSRVKLGIELQTVELPAYLREQEKLEQTTGILVVGTRGRSETHRDLLIGDILLNVAGETVPDGQTLRRVIVNKTASEALPVKLVRGGTLHTVDVTLLVAS